MKGIDLTNKKFGMLTAESVSHSGRKGVVWNCKCECGGVATYSAAHLLSGKIKACGCQRGKKIADAARTHGQWNTPTHRSWQNMHARCRGGKGKGDRWYAAKGITVCERWGKYENFLADMGERPDGKSLDRIDNSKGYSPDNCRWATAKEQALNRSNVTLYEYMGRKLSISDWVREITGRPDLIVRTNIKKLNG